MNLLIQAAKRLQGMASPRALAILLATAIGALFPTMAFAAEENIVLNFTASDKIYLYISLGFGLLAIVSAFLIRKGVIAASPGNEKMQEVGAAIREGALAYLLRQVKTMMIFVVLLAVGLFFLYQGQFGSMVAGYMALAFVGGVAASYIAGYSGMLMAVNANTRTAHAALSSYKRALEVAFRAGAVAGLVTVGMGLIGATIIIMFGGADAMKILVGFGFGGSLAALFMRVGGGIFTKAADVGADLVGKVEAGIPEDDPRNPATIADNVGDNVGDCAGMAADVFESYEVTLVAAIILGAATSVIFDQQTWMRLILFALMARGVGIVASIVGILMVKGTDDLDADPLRRIRLGFYWSAGIAGLLTLGLAYYMMGGRGNPIQTDQLRSLEAERYEQFANVIAARDASARTRNIPSWKVTPKDILGTPAVTELEIAPNPMLAADMQREQTVQQIFAFASQFERSPKPANLAGYSALTADSTNPAMVYAVNKPPASVQEASQARPDGPFVSVSDLVANQDLKFYKLERSQSAPAFGQAEGATTKTTVQYVYGPATKGFIDDFAKSQSQAGTTVKVVEEFPARVFANSQGNVALGIDGDPKTTFFQATDSFRTYYAATPKEVSDAILASQTSPGQGGVPPAIEIAVGTLSHTVVPWLFFFYAIVFGLLMAFAIEWLTDYYVSTHKKPVQEVAGVSSAGPAPMIITGFAYALESSVFMVFAIVLALLFPLFLFSPAAYGGYILSFYGIALVGLGLLTTTGYVLAMDTFGPISDNAQGVFEMSGAGHDNPNGSKAVQRLDAAGNTTKALTKGFAIATAVVAAVALFHTYLESAKLGEIGLRLDIPEIFLGLLIGGAAPYLFSAFAINAVGRASFQLINEVRKQFREDPGIMAGTSKPNYGRCVAIVTRAAQTELLGPGILAIALPAAVAFGFSIGKDPTFIGGQPYNLTGAQALGGFLAGAILSGQLMAVLLANSGGMWDNAKKLIEDGLYGGKGTEAHKAGIVCDTVGDPFKDTAGPALNPLIKVMNLVALLLAPIVIRPFNNTILTVITVVSVGALAISIYFSKRGSLSASLQQASSEADAASAHKLSSPELPSAPEEAIRRKITVEDATAEGVKVEEENL